MLNSLPRGFLKFPFKRTRCCHDQVVRNSETTSSDSDDSDESSINNSSTAGRGGFQLSPSTFSRTLRNPVVRQGLSVIQPAVEAIPIVGPPIKAVIELVLQISDMFEGRDKNKKVTLSLLEKLHDLYDCVENGRSDRTVNMAHLERLAKQLEGAHLEIVNKSTSVIHSSSIAVRFEELEKQVDNYLQVYNTCALLSLENGMATLLSGATIRSASLQSLLRSDLQNSSIRSSIKATLTFVDPRGKNVDILLHMCATFEDFRAFVMGYYRMNTDHPIRGGPYVERGDYFLTFRDEEVSPLAVKGHLWDVILSSRGPLEMGVVIEKEDTSTGKKRCLRCNASLPLQGGNDGQQLFCLHCDFKLSTSPFVPWHTSSNFTEIGPTEGDIDYFANIKLRAGKEDEFDDLDDSEIDDETLEEALLENIRSGSKLRLFALKESERAHN